jgi:hypothetical protein
MEGPLTSSKGSFGVIMVVRVVYILVVVLNLIVFLFNPFSIVGLKTSDQGFLA